MGIMRDLFQISKMAKEMGMDISVSELKDELLGDVDVEELEASEAAQKPSSVNPRPVLSEEERLAYGERLMDYETYTDEEAGYLYAYEKPQWPVSNVMFAAAGPLAAAMRSFLDDIEPLVGLVADEMDQSDNPILDARKVLIALGYLNLTSYIILLFQYLNEPSLRSRSTQKSQVFFNNNYTYDAQLRNAWLDEYPFTLWDVIGWNSNSNPFDAFNSLNGWEMIRRFRQVTLPINEKYEYVPDKELYESACSKMVRNLGDLVGIGYEQMRKICRVHDFLPPIDDWHLFLETSQGFIPNPTLTSFKESIEKVERDWTNPKTIVTPRLQLLKSFALTFQPPYLSKDMDLWREIAKETYEKAKRDPEYQEGMKSLFHDPYDPEYGTSFPKREVFDEIHELIFWAQDGAISFDNAEEAGHFFFALMSFQMFILARHHYPTKNQIETLNFIWEGYIDSVNQIILQDLKKTDAIESGSFLNKINGLVGLESVKKRLGEWAALVGKSVDAENLPPLQHIVFAGNPGTGKTTVATLLGEVFATLGLLKSGHVVSVTRGDLVAQYTGQTAPRVNSAIDKAMGGILFIDEAYTLRRDSLGSDQDSFGQEAIDALLTRMENDRGKFLVIAAGYPAEMQRFVDSNPGLRSRFSDTWNFDDYSEDELFTMFTKEAERKSLELHPDLRETFKLLASVERQKANFANARWQRTLLENAQRRMASRLSQKNDGDSRVSGIDLTDPPKEVSVSQDALDSIREKLNGLVGLASVKEDVENLIAFQLVQQRRQAEGLPLLGSGLGHLVFSGPPGTGKTTVARLIGQFYKELGLLESGHCVETQRADLVAGFIGQTAIRTKEMINKAMGGILFIDEAYTLVKPSSPGVSQDFGQEAVDTLLKMMEDSKGKFVVIIAGYSDRMEDFLESNPGMRSRFSKTLNFEPWNADEFVEVVRKSLIDSQFTMNDQSLRALAEISEQVIANSSFASGRTARSLKERIIEAQARRLSSDVNAPLTEIHDSDVRAGMLKLQK